MSAMYMLMSQKEHCNWSKCEILAMATNVVLLSAHFLYRVLTLPAGETPSYTSDAWLVFGGHLLLAVLFGLTIGFHDQLVHSMPCCRMLHHPYKLPPEAVSNQTTDRVNVKKYRKAFDKSKYLELVPRGSEKFQEIERFVQNTWQYDERRGADSQNLTHNRIHVTCVYKCNVKATQQCAYDAISGDTHLPQELLKELIKTDCVLNMEPNNNNNTLAPPSGKPVQLLVSGDRCVAIGMPPCDDDDMPRVHKPRTCVHTSTAPVRTDDVSPTETHKLLQSSDQSQSHDSHHHHTAASELRLFHGTGIQHILSIVKYGFDLTKASDGSLYGRGIYFALSSEKADQYADDRHSRRPRDLTMLVVRVKPGNVERSTHTAADVTRAQKRPMPGCSVDNQQVTSVAGWDKRFREVVVRQEARCLPEYVVVYDRLT